MCAPLGAVGSDSSGGSEAVRSSRHKAERPFAPRHGQVQVPTPGCAPAVPLPGQHQQSRLLLSPLGVCRRVRCSLRCGSRTEQDQPGGARPGALAALTPSQAGCATTGCGHRDAVLPSSSHPCCRLRIPQGSARSPRLPSGQDHTSDMPDLTARGLCSGSSLGCTVMSPSWHQPCSPAVARARLLLPICGESRPKACSSSSCSGFRAWLHSGFVFPEGFAAPLLGSASLP